MKNHHCLALIAALCMAVTIPAHAQKSKGKGKPDKTAPAGPNKDETVPGGQDTKGKWADVKITTGEREVIQTYVREFDGSGKPGKGRKKKDLPPGLQKKLARGGTLPPGWEKKVARGEVMSEEVFKECHPLPPEVVVKLPSPPQGVITVTIGGKVVRLLEATREILDVFEVGR